MFNQPRPVRFNYVSEVGENWTTFNFPNFTPDFTEPMLSTSDPDVMRVCGGKLKFTLTLIVQLFPLNSCALTD